MLPTPEISVILGNLQYDSHVFAAQVTRAMLPAPNTARLMFPAAVSIEVVPGDNAQLTVTAGDNATVVLTGKVHTIEHRPHHTVVTLTDGTYDLCQYRPSATFEKQNAMTIAQTLAADVQLQVGTVAIDLNLPQYAAHQKRTAAEHIAELARFSDGFALVDGDGKLQVNNWSDGPADAAIKYGRDLMDFSFTQHHPLGAVALIGNGPSGSADAPNALRHDTGQLPESVAAPGKGVKWQAHPILRTPSAVQTAQSGITRERNQRVGQALLVGLLRPDFVPGMKLEIQGVPAPNVGSTWVLTQVQHELVHGSYAKTTLHAREDARAEDLLGSVLGAVGGLL